MSRIAIIGAGISGLTAAYYLSRHHRVTVFERAERIGGHTNTLVVDSSRGPVAVDTGFIVHNQVTYPNFCRLLKELGIATQPSDMSFAVTSPSGFEYSSYGLAGFFAQSRNWFRPAHYLLLREILRFNRNAPRLLRDETSLEVTLADYLRQQRYSSAFVNRYLYPMASAIWSTPIEDMHRFPAHTLVRFFWNHGLLSIRNHPQWLTIRGGSHRYLEPLTKPFRDGIKLGTRIVSVTRTETGIRISYRDAGRDAVDEAGFDEVVFACHGNQILPMLLDASPQEREILSNFKTSRNEAVLHTDTAMLPRRKAARASWNYFLTSRGCTVTYDMNRLQNLSSAEQFCVSLNPGGMVDEDKVIRRIVYFHPIFSHDAVRAQARWGEISGVNHTHFCGAYWRYGFHEDGVQSALKVVESIGARSQAREAVAV